MTLIAAGLNLTLSFFDRHAQSGGCRYLVELVDGNEFEESLRVGFGSSGHRKWV